VREKRVTLDSIPTKQVGLTKSFGRQKHATFCGLICLTDETKRPDRELYLEALRDAIQSLRRRDDYRGRISTNLWRREAENVPETRLRTSSLYYLDVSRTYLWLKICRGTCPTNDGSDIAISIRLGCFFV